MAHIYELEVKGEQFTNGDGSDRRPVVKEMLPGVRVRLARDRDNPFDADCIKVTLLGGFQIGVLALAHAHWIGPYLDAGKVGEVVVSKRWYGEQTAAWHLWLRAEVDSDGEPMPPADAYTPTPQPPRINYSTTTGFKGSGIGCMTLFGIGMVLYLLIHS